MKNWLRVFLICFVLLGGTAFFGYWYMNQFNQIFDDLSSAHLAYPSFNRSDIKLASTTPEIAELASATPEIIEDLASSTDELGDFNQVTTTDPIIEQSAIVLNTGTGYLNVRKGPGLGFKKETQVDVGSVFKILDEQGDWIKIEISSTTSGWVLAKYVEK